MKGVSLARKWYYIYIQIRDYDTSLCFSKVKKTTQKQRQTMPQSFWHAACLILLVTAKTKPLLSSRWKTTENPTSCPLWNPRKILGGDTRSVVISILRKEPVGNLARRLWNLNKKSNQTFEITTQVQKKQNNRLCTKHKVMGEISPLLSACLLLCWLVVCLQTD